MDFEYRVLLVAALASVLWLCLLCAAARVCLTLARDPPHEE